MTEKKEKKKHKIINSKKVLEIIEQIEGVFQKEELSMLDVGYIVNQLQRTMDAWDKDRGKKAMFEHDMKNTIEKIKDIQTKKDL